MHIITPNFKMINENPTLKDLGLDVKFNRIRRVTGYLVGDTDKWNTGKLNELNDRVKHTVGVGTYDISSLQDAG